MHSYSRAYVQLWIAALLLLAISFAGCVQGSSVTCEPSSACVCDYNGMLYAAGKRFKDAEGCNDCECNADGSVGCTDKLCERACGGPMDQACRDGEYCDYPAKALCGALETTGVCKKKSVACPDVAAPVCACGDLTFPNACEASRSGKSIAYPWPCDGAPCGVQGAVRCSDSQFCKLPDEICGRADAGGAGTCEPRPDVCSDEKDPVCGCDLQTYDNDCVASRAGISVRYRGSCESLPM